MYQPKYEPVGYSNTGDDTTCSITVGTANPGSLDSGKEAFSTPEGGSTLSFHDIHYTVQVAAGRCRKVDKTILNGIR